MADYCKPQTSKVQIPNPHISGAKLVFCTNQHTVSVLGRDEGYKVKYTPSPKGVPEGKAQGNS